MRPFSPWLEQELQSRYDVHRWFEISSSEQFIAEHGDAIQAVVTGGEIGIPAELMARLSSLRMVAINGVGFDKVDLEECRRRGVRVTTTPNVLTDDVADLAVGLTIALLRGIPASDRYVRDGLWKNGERPLARKVSGRRFGIVGLGQIGNAIGQRLAPFGPVAYCDITRKQVPYQFFASAVELAHWCNILILATAANVTTHRLIGREVLDALGAEGYLVNVARGSLVDEAELISALGSNRIAGAALDVFENEPHVPQALASSAKVLLTPHIASATVETREAMARAVLTNLDAFFAGQTLPGAIA
ncbi:MAG TPA: 2-hydroxyacid dehydrogenase, partial [Steroidobacteraceae bacterium]|nr:2-hydroxyacid dehydrogenase [Steroidobacteraceae bacterium]